MIHCSYFPQPHTCQPTCNRVGGIMLALCSCLVSPAVWAEAVSDQEESGETKLETMIVTAHRIPVTQPDVASSISTIERDLIDQRQSIFATDILRDLPGIAVSRISGFGSQTQVRIRGAEANHVLVMIDGIQANDPAGSDEFDFSSLTTFDVERIEFVRGPQSALWGSDAVAGVINVTTRSGSEPLEAGGFLEAGSLATIHGGGRFSANSDRSGIDLSASYFNTDGNSAASAGGEDDGYENTTLGLKYHWKPSDTTWLGFSARHTDSTTEIDDIDFITGLPADADRESDDSLLLLSLNGGLTTMGDRLEHRLRLTFLDSDRIQLSAGRKESSTAAEKVGIYYQSTLRLGNPASADQHHLTFAVDHEEEKFQQRGAASIFGDPNQDQEMDNTGYVLEYLTRLLGFNLSASVRYDDNSDFDNITTYRLTSVYTLPSTETRLHASYGTGQKSPTFIERYGFFSKQFIGNPDLAPEESKGFDIGIDQTLFNSRIQMDVTYFNEQLEDEIDGFVFDLSTFTFTADNLAGTSRRKGVEIEILGRLTEQLDATASYTYTDSQQPNPAGGKTREVRRPRHMAALNLNYKFVNERANVNLNLSYTGKQTDQFFPPPTFAPQTIELDNYTLVDLTGSFELSNRVTLYARVENLFDEDYTNVIGFQTPGLGVYAGIRASFGR